MRDQESARVSERIRRTKVKGEVCVGGICV